MAEQIEHYLKTREVDRLKKIAQLFSQYKQEIKQNWINILYQIHFINSEEQLASLDNAFQKLIDDFVKYLSDGKVGDYFKSNKNMSKNIAYEDISFSKYNEIFNLFKQSYLNILVKNVKDKDDLNADLFVLDKLHSKTITIISEIYFELHDQVIMSLAKLSKIHDLETGLHLERTQRYAVLLAQEMGLDDDFVDAIRQAGPLHDIGSLGVPDNVLHKLSDELSPEEQKQMEQHVIIGANLIDEILKVHPVAHGFLIVARDIALYHHEHWDGSGYPKGLKGEEIPLSARIFALPDFYDTMRSVRKQKHPWSHAKAVKTIKQQSGTYFDPKIVEAFLRIQDKFEKISQEILDENEISILANTNL